LKNDLLKSNCEACRADAVRLTDEEIKLLHADISSWIIINDEGIEKLVSSFAFTNYKDSIEYANKVADLAESEDHHPEIKLEWGKVTISWWSHKINGLHKNDFICAAKTDQLFEN